MKTIVGKTRKVLTEATIEDSDNKRQAVGVWRGDSYSPLQSGNIPGSSIGAEDRGTIG